MTDSGKIEIKGIEAQAVVDVIVAQFFSNWEITERVNERIMSMVREKLDDLIKESVREETKLAVRDKLENGWKLYDSYGGNVKNITVAQRIEETLQNKSKRGGWNSKDPDRSFVENTVIDEVELYVKNALRDDLKEARELFREQVNKVLQSKLADTLAEHLGIGGKP